MRRIAWSILLAIIFVSLGVFAYLGFDARDEPVRACAITLPRSETSRIGFLDTWQPYDCVRLETVSTLTDRQTGLSDRESLNPRTGMLFDFESPQTACMWMKDMRFALDIIWLDTSKTITKIEPNVRPETYPESFCAENTRYVIELNAGTAERAGLTVGQTLKL